MSDKTQITSLQQLYNAAIDRRAVVCPDLLPWSKPISAAFVMNQQGHVLLRLMKRGMYLYEPGSKNR
jgi:hypothetical protein